MFPVQTYGMPELSGNTEHKRGGVDYLLQSVDGHCGTPRSKNNGGEKEAESAALRLHRLIVYSAQGEEEEEVVVVWWCSGGRGRGCWPVFEAVMTTTPPQKQATH